MTDMKSLLFGKNKTLLHLGASAGQGVFTSSLNRTVE
jgi:hypothetical protein